MPVIKMSREDGQIMTEEEQDEVSEAVFDYAMRPDEKSIIKVNGINYKIEYTP